MPFHSDDPLYTPTHKLLRHLDHTPVYVLPYEAFDGATAGDIYAMFISVGIAQWDPYAVSVKLMRHSGGKWARQAEELP